MATVTVTVRPAVSDFVRGGYAPSRNKIDVDLDQIPPEDRNVLANCIDQRNDGSFVARAARAAGGFEPYAAVEVAAPTVEALLSAVRAGVETQAAYAAEQAQRKAAIRAETLAVLRERKTRADHSWVDDVRYDYEEPAWPSPVDEEVKTSAEANAWTAELKTKREQSEAGAAAEAKRKREEREREEAAAEARKEAQRAALRAWAQEHGSERVQLLIEENHSSWVDIAQDEFLSAHTPDGYATLESTAKGSYRVKERTKPTADDILALREARKLCEGNPYLSDPGMCWIVTWRDAEADEDADEDGEVVDRRYPAIEIKVSTPITTYGANRTVCREVVQG